MTRRFFGFLGALAGLAFVTGSCVDDPLADLDADPTTILTSHSSVQLTQGAGGIAITATPVDGRFTPLAIPVTAAGCDAAVTATVDTSYHPVPVTSARFIVRGVGAAGSCVNFTAGGVTKAVAAVVLPTSFTGTVSSTTPQGGDTLTINSTAQLKFDTAFVAVTFGGGVASTIVSKTADVVRVLVPFSTAAPLSIAGINVTYVTGLRVTLPTSATVTQTGDRWGTGDVAYATAPTIATPAAAGVSFRMITNFGAVNNANCAEFGPAPPNGSTGPCVIYRFDLAAPTSLRFTTDWNSTADIDTYVCDDTGLPGCFESGGSGAGAAKPETINAFTYAAGTHYFVLEVWSGTIPTNLYVTVARP